MNRREFSKFALCSAGVALLGMPAQAQRRTPFCGFSLRGGWTNRARNIVTREASGSDRSGVPQIVSRIRDELGFTGDFRILITRDEDNAYAMSAGGERILGVDVDFLARLNRRVGTQWSAIQVIAHEIGHHIAGFDGDNHSVELNADYWSGQALQRLGSSEEAATAAIMTIGGEVDSSSHPNKRRRAAIIAKGWRDAARDHIDRSHCTRGC